VIIPENQSCAKFESSLRIMLQQQEGDKGSEFNKCKTFE